jgi:hypothetical protein
MRRLTVLGHNLAHDLCSPAGNLIQCITPFPSKKKKKKSTAVAAPVLPSRDSLAEVWCGRSCGTPPRLLGRTGKQASTCVDGLGVLWCDGV